MMQENMQEKIRKYWEKLPFLGTEMMEVETIKGQKVMIPKKLSTYWENVKISMDDHINLGLDPLDILAHDEISPIIRTIQEIYLGIFEVCD